MFQGEAPPPPPPLKMKPCLGWVFPEKIYAILMAVSKTFCNVKILRPFFFSQVLRRELYTGCFSWELFTYPFSVLQLGDAVIELELLAGWATTLHCGHRSPPPPHYNPSRAPKMSSLGHHQLAFQTAKKSLTSAPTLAFFDQATAMHRC